MVGTINSKSLLPKLAIMMLTDVTIVPADLTQETSLNGKYVKGILTAVTDPNAANGSATHTHTSDGDHLHSGTVASHSHSATSSAGPNVATNTTALGFVAPISHTHAVSTDSIALAEASSDGDHTHNSFTNDLEHRTIAFYKKTNTVTHMSRKALPRNMTFFYSKTGTLPSELLENLNFVDKHFQGNATPNTESGSNLHQHDSQTHTHPTDISAHEHVASFGGAGNQSTSAQSGGVSHANSGHGHNSGTAATTGKSSTPVTSGISTGHTHDNITHEPAFKTLRLLQVNSVKMSNTGVPKNCIFLWLDTIALLALVSGWQVSDGTNDTTSMLAVFPKGSATPGTTGGSDTHTHSIDATSHSHTGADVGHTHSSTGTSATNTSTVTRLGGGVNAAAGSHTHTPGTFSTQADQTITITNAASNHDHGSQNSEPDSTTVAFIERITV